MSDKNLPTILLPPVPTDGAVARLMGYSRKDCPFPLGSLEKLKWLLQFAVQDNSIKVSMIKNWIERESMLGRQSPITSMEAALISCKKKFSS